MARDEHYSKVANDSNAKEIMMHFNYIIESIYILQQKLPQINITDNIKDIGLESVIAKIKSKLENIYAICSSNKEVEEYSLYKEQYQNVLFSIENIEKAIEENDLNKLEMLIKYELIIFVKELREEIYFWGYIYTNSSKLERYYKKEFVTNHSNEYVNNNKLKYDVSIFILAKDNIEYTKQCVDSILKYTDCNQINYELILINHGSTDNTQEYFEQIKEENKSINIKILHFLNNVRMLSFSSAMRACEGKYMTFVSNDTIVTKNWLSLLLSCIQSDKAIISATPTTPNVSNFQGTQESYTNMNEMQEFAEKFNYDDPSKWERRARIMPVIAVYDITKINKTGFTDRYFTTMEFWDDDFSLRVRRAGYKQILCRNVFCHHFGSVTGKEAQVKENTLAKGKQLFINKNKVDPWKNGAYYDWYAVNSLSNYIVANKEKVNVLGIDCGFGDTLLQIGNMLKNKKSDYKFYNIVTDSTYIPDLTPLSDTLHVAHTEENIFEYLEDSLNKNRFNYIYINQPVENYKNWKRLIKALKYSLSNDGVLVVSASNMLHADNYNWFKCLVFPASKESLNYINPDSVKKELSENFRSINVKGIRSWTSQVILTSMCKSVQNNRSLEENIISLDTVKYQYLCFGREKN